jgi:hypothetical protein
MHSCGVAVLVLAFSGGPRLSGPRLVYRCVAAYGSARWASAFVADGDVGLLRGISGLLGRSSERRLAGPP